MEEIMVPHLLAMARRGAMALGLLAGLSAPVLAAPSGLALMPGLSDNDMPNPLLVQIQGRGEGPTMGRRGHRGGASGIIWRRGGHHGRMAGRSFDRGARAGHFRSHRGGFENGRLARRPFFGDGGRRDFRRGDFARRDHDRAGYRRYAYRGTDFNRRLAEHSFYGDNGRRHFRHRDDDRGFRGRYDRRGYHGGTYYKRYGRYYDRYPRYRYYDYYDYDRDNVGIYLNLGVPIYGLYSGYYDPFSYSYYGPQLYQGTGWSDHVQWCVQRYRSYRPADNTFQPYDGPRRQCVSPYS